jgi:hypothetical protein
MRGLRAWWGRNFLHAELAVCVSTALLVIWLGNYFWGYPRYWGPLIGIRATFYGTLASIFGSLLGFTITGGAAAFGSIESERFTLIRESSAFPKFWKVFYAAGRATAFATLSSLVALLLDRDTHPISWPLYLAIFSSLLGFARVARSAWLLYFVVKIASRLNRDQS